MLIIMHAKTARKIRKNDNLMLLRTFSDLDVFLWVGCFLACGLGHWFGFLVFVFLLSFTVIMRN